MEKVLLESFKAHAILILSAIYPWLLLGMKLHKQMSHAKDEIKQMKQAKNSTLAVYRRKKALVLVAKKCACVQTKGQTKKKDTQDQGSPPFSAFATSCESDWVVYNTNAQPRGKHSFHKLPIIAFTCILMFISGFEQSRSHSILVFTSFWARLWASGVNQGEWA